MQKPEKECKKHKLRSILALRFYVPESVAAGILFWVHLSWLTGFIFLITAIPLPGGLD